MYFIFISIFRYTCESWILTVELQNRGQAFEMRCYLRLLDILYKDHVTNKEVLKPIRKDPRRHLRILLITIVISCWLP